MCVYLCMHASILSLIQKFQHFLDSSLKCTQQAAKWKRPSPRRARCRSRLTRPTTRRVRKTSELLLLRTEATPRARKTSELLLLPQNSFSCIGTSSLWRRLTRPATRAWGQVLVCRRTNSFASELVLFW